VGLNKVLNRSFSECIEQLIISNIKLTWFDHAKQDELARDPDDIDYEQIAGWEFGARASNERRAEARNAIDQLLSEAIETGEYEFVREVRTFARG
jgi:hypothetical protein